MAFHANAVIFQRHRFQNTGPGREGRAAERDAGSLDDGLWEVVKYGVFLNMREPRPSWPEAQSFQVKVNSLNDWFGRHDASVQSLQPAGHRSTGLARYGEPKRQSQPVEMVGFLVREACLGL